MAKGSRKLSKKLTVVSLLTGVVMVGSIAFAAWTASGSGSGYAKARTAAALTTSDASASTVAQLYPGGSGDVKITVNNPNPYDVDVTDITGNGAITSDKGAACNASTGVSFADQTGLVGYTVPGGGSTTFTLTNAASMDNTSHNSCQGGVFTIPVDLAGVSA